MSIKPFPIGQPNNPIDFLEQNLGTPSQSRTPLNQVVALTQPHLNNPNLFLSEVIADQTILQTTVLTVTSDTSVPGSIPTTGGGMANIAFLSGVGAPNANAAFTEATFWIERVRGENGNPDFNQLQYTQRVLLNFADLSWPHITVATLREV